MTEAQAPRQPRSTGTEPDFQPVQHTHADVSLILQSYYMTSVATAVSGERDVRCETDAPVDEGLDPRADRREQMSVAIDRDDFLAAVEEAREAIKVLESVPNGAGYQTKTEILSIHPSLGQWDVQNPVAISVASTMRQDGTRNSAVGMWYPTLESFTVAWAKVVDASLIRTSESEERHTNAHYMRKRSIR